MRLINKDLIINYIKDNNISIESFCTLCDIHKDTLTSVVNFHEDIPIEVCKNICNLIGCSFIELLSPDLERYFIYIKMIIEKDQLR